LIFWTKTCKMDANLMKIWNLSYVGVFVIVWDWRIAARSIGYWASVGKLRTWEIDRERQRNWQNKNCWCHAWISTDVL
jgi:hypothetical protein